MKIISTSLTLTECISEGIREAFEYYENVQMDQVGRYSRLKDLDNFSNLPEDEIRSSGYVVDTLEAAVWCLLNTDSYKACVLKAVNLGDDTDTVGAVAGGIAGMYYGINTIPSEWLEAVAKKQYIIQLCNEF